jgi:hypothetical protein
VTRLRRTSGFRVVGKPQPEISAIPAVLPARQIDQVAEIGAETDSRIALNFGVRAAWHLPTEPAGLVLSSCARERS